MTIALSQADYWALVQEDIARDQPAPGDGMTWLYLPQLGRGSIREIQLRDGLLLMVGDYSLHEDVVIHAGDRQHPLEYIFDFSDHCAGLTDPIPYHLFGSGLAPRDYEKQYADRPIRWLNVHIEPEVFRSFVGSPDGQVPDTLRHLLRESNQEYYSRPGQATPAMQIALQQILHCPYQGFTQRMFLEGKVWELMALLLEQETNIQPNQQPADLKPDDVDRVHQAKAILVQNLENPPSLAQLARQVSLNECTLKRGFRQVFGTTAFGYLHHYRLEQAKQLLTTGEMSVAQVAQSIGFARNYFTKAFCQKFGCTPGAYRKSCR